MFVGLKKSVTTSVINGVLRGFVNNPDTRATAVGTALAGIIGAQINWGALIFPPHDLHQLSLLIAAVLVWVLGYITNKHPKGQAVVEDVLKELEKMLDAPAHSPAQSPASVESTKEKA